MKTVYFVYIDKYAHERQSDGVEFCFIPQFHNDKIYFYCNEYCLFWDFIETVGDLGKSCDFTFKKSIRILPATLEDIVNNNLIDYVDTVKEYDDVTKKTTYIHLKTR